MGHQSQYVFDISECVRIRAVHAITEAFSDRLAVDFCTL